MNGVVSTAAHRTAVDGAAREHVWPEAVRRSVAALAQQHRPPAGSLRVLVGAGGAAVAGPYLAARARVVGTCEGTDDDPRYHVRLPADESGLPRPHRLDDADLIVVPCLEPSCDVGRLLTAVSRALAAGGLAVLVLPAHEGRESWLGGRIGRARLEQRHHERLHVDGAGWFELVVVADLRPAPRGPAALAALDRTACVDRSRVLRAIEQAPWGGPDSAAASGSVGALRAALHRQLATGEPDVRALPWPAAVAARTASSPAGRDEPPGRDVLAIMPHPDDESIYAGGTLAGLHAAGLRVGLVVATDGAGGRGGAGLAARRAQELLAAAAVLGLQGLRCLGWSDFGKYRDAARTTPVTAGDALRTWGLDRSLEQLVAEIRRERPRVLLGLDPEADPNLSLHGHHLGLGVLVAVAFHAAADPRFAPHLGPAWACDEHRVMAPLAHARLADAFDVDRDAKRRALLTHATQAYSTARLLDALDDRQRPAMELTRRLQARRVVPWWLMRRASEGALDAGIDWAAEAVRVRTMPRPRAELVELLRRQARAAAHDPAHDPAVDASLHMLAHDDAVAVVTGQQVGLMGGPAYTLAKALTAVALARRLQRHGVRAVPVFWLASQDHDLHEAQRVARLEGSRLELGLADTGAPVGPRTLGPGIRALCEQWAAGLGEVHPEVLAWVERAYRAEHDFTTAFVTLMREATRGTGLLWLDPMDPAFARLAQPLLRRALVEAPAVAGALAEARERLRARGQEEVVPTAGPRTLVFAQAEHGARRRLAQPSAAQLAALDERPERLSPSALLRPVIQDAVLPTIAYVGGPTELRYLAQTNELYAWAGVPQPRAVPRVSLQLAASHDLAVLVGLGLDAQQPEAHPLERIGRAALSPAASVVLGEIEAALVRLDRSRPRASIDAGDLRARLARIERRMPGALPSLPRTARCWSQLRAGLRARADAALTAEPVMSARAVTRLRHALHGLRRSLLRDGRRSRPEAVAAWHRASARPVPAERRMTTAELLARTSPALPHAVVAALEAELSPTLAIRIGGSMGGAA